MPAQIDPPPFCNYSAEDTTVILGSRNLERGNAARDEIVAAAPHYANRVEVLQLDVGDDSSVAAAASIS